MPFTGLPQALLQLPRMPPPAGLHPVLRLPRWRDLLQGMLRQDIRAQGIRVRRVGLDARAHGAHQPARGRGGEREDPVRLSCLNSFLEFFC